MNRRRFLGLSAATGGTLVGAMGMSRSVASTGTTRAGDLLAGVSVQEPMLRTLDGFDRWTGTPHAVVVYYATLGQSGPERRETVERLEATWAHGHVPMLVLEPTIGSIESTPTTIATDVAAGDYDAELDAWRDTLTGWLQRGLGRANRRLYLEFAPEMNGDWVPWGAPAGGSTPDDYVAMFRRAHARLMSKGLTQSEVQWVWGPNAKGRGGIAIQHYFPGDDVVDWAGVNGYNWHRWGGWNTPAEIYGKALEQIRSVTDAPIAITEVGCSSDVEDGNDTARKAVWIREFYDYAVAEGIKMVCWFNHTKETDWGVFGGPRGTETWTSGAETVFVYDAYREVLNRPSVLGAHPTDRRRLTEREFRGAF
ncbi:Glycosyl hydrolase family 26 [Halogranum rubrum]|uniref:Glycosyl hydrolase family 26 n=1 Tax=Halogranum rubrum TaxID=553466 RepID=A0A1I4H993_9EURY|nr:glycosyl hydrolase [Halogranum rubrum]SFL38858.1 Glycosyl hydrolase family 26 [Halogranum rubrum]